MAPKFLNTRGMGALKRECQMTSPLASSLLRTPHYSENIQVPHHTYTPIMSLTSLFPFPLFAVFHSYPPHGSHHPSAGT